MSEWLIRAHHFILFHHPSTRSHSLSTCQVLEKHTQELSQVDWDSLLSISKLPCGFQCLTTPFEQFLLFHPKETKLERLSQHGSNVFCAKILGHYVIKVFVWDRNVISQLMGTHDLHHSRGFCPFDSVILISMVNVCDTSCLKFCC